MRTSSTMAVAMGALALVMPGAAMAKSGAPAAAPMPAVSRPALLPRVAAPPVMPRPATPALNVRPPSLHGHIRPPFDGHHRPWPGRRFVHGAPFPAYGAYPTGWAEPPLALSSESPLDTSYGYASTPYDGYYRAPTPCVPPTIIIIGSGMKGAVTPPVARHGGCTTPQVVYQRRADARPRVIESESRRGKKRALRARY